ncbi:hypothetical protein [Saccharopolyspora rosea]
MPDQLWRLLLSVQEQLERVLVAREHAQCAREVNGMRDLPLDGKVRRPHCLAALHDVRDVTEVESRRQPVELAVLALVPGFLGDTSDRLGVDVLRLKPTAEQRPREPLRRHQRVTHGRNVVVVLFILEEHRLAERIIQRDPELTSQLHEDIDPVDLPLTALNLADPVLRLPLNPARTA